METLAADTLERSVAVDASAVDANVATQLAFVDVFANSIVRGCFSAPLWAELVELRRSGLGASLAIILPIDPGPFLALAAALGHCGGGVERVAGAGGVRTRPLIAHEAEALALVHALRLVQSLNEAVRAVAYKTTLRVLAVAALANILNYVAFLHVSARVAVEFVSEVARARVVAVEIFAQAVAARTIVALVDVDASAPVLGLLESIVAEANEASQGVLAVTVSAHVSISRVFFALIDILALASFRVNLVSRITDTSVRPV